MFNKKYNDFGHGFNLKTESNVNDWIEKIVPGKTFADLGGIWNTVNERVSVAALAGAREYTMIDVRPFEDEWWAKYRTRLCERGVDAAAEKVLDCADREAVKNTIPVDVLHCTGVIYHIPNFFKFMSNISLLTNEYLILGSMIIPQTLHNAAGTITCSGLLPNIGLTQDQKDVLTYHFKDVALDIVRLDNSHAINLQNERAFDNYVPWWWFFTPGYLHDLLLDFGYEIIEHKCIWTNFSYAFLCRKTLSSSGATS